MKIKTIRARLILLVSTIIIPIVLFAVLLFNIFQNSEQLRTQEAVFDAVRRSTAIIDREVAEMTATLEVLATSPSLLIGDLESFDKQARAVLQMRGRYISMRDRKGQQIINTNRPFGTPLPVATDPVLLANDARVFSTGTMSYSDLFIGTTAKTPLVSIGVPIRREGEIAYVLALTLDPVRLANMLADTAASNWTLSLVDRRDRVIACSRQHERYINSQATETFRLNATKDNGFYTGITLEGDEVMVGYVRSPVTG